MTVHLTVASQNGCGATFWNVEMKESEDGVPGRLRVLVEIVAQREGLHIAGKVIPWDQIVAAHAHALNPTVRTLK